MPPRGRYTADSRERVRDAVDFIQIVGARTELRRAGPRRYVGLCPFHEERTPSFGIDPVEKLYHCFGCGAGGDLFSFVMETESLDFAEALETLADRFGVQLEREDEDPRAAERRSRRDRLLALLERTAAFYVRMLWEGDEAAGAREYLASRGLEEATLREFRVGYAPSAWDRVLTGSQRAGFSVDELLAAGLAQRGRGGVYDRFRGRLMFPLADARGRVLGFGARALRDNQQPKYLNSAEGEVFSKGRNLFATHLARADAARSGAVVLAEGYTDVVALHQAGIRNAVGLMGTAMTEAQAAELAKLARRVLLCLDADAAGQEAVLRAAAAVKGGSHGLDLRVAPLPAGSDPAELVAREGAGAVRDLLERAVPFARFQVERALATGDVGSAEGRDRVLAEVAAVIRPLAPSVLREELVQLVAGRLALSEGLVAATLGNGGAAARAGAVAGPGGGGAPAGPGGSAGGGRNAGAGAGAWSGVAAGAPGGAGAASAGEGAARRALDRREEGEVAFLALCLAVPDHGPARLAGSSIDDVFSRPLTRRAAAHLRDHADAPSSGLPPDDPELSRLVAELVLRARATEDATVADLDRAGLHLELARLEREIASARLEGAPVGQLAADRQRVLAELRRHVS